MQIIPLFKHPNKFRNDLYAASIKKFSISSESAKLRIFEYF